MTDPPPKPRYAHVNLHPAAALRATELAAMLGKEKGVRVTRPDALTVAIEEAIKRREQAMLAALTGDDHE
jgi:hypothetical protein